MPSAALLASADVSTGTLGVLQLTSSSPHGVASLADGEIEVMLHRRPMEVREP